MRCWSLSRWVIRLACAAALPVSVVTVAQTIAPGFSADYSAFDLGSVPGVPGPLGGVVFKAGDPNTLLIGGSANNGGGGIYQVGLVRDLNGHITGFSGSATLLSTAPEIDGGLAYAPNGVLFYTGYAENLLGQIKPGSVAPDQIDVLSGLGIASSVGTLAFVPAGFPGAGQLKVASYSAGTFYSVGYSLNGGGTYDLGPATLEATLSGGPEGILYISDDNPGFANPSVLIAEWGAGTVGAYEIDANGDPIAGTRQDFITGLSGAEGAVMDPLTGDFIFSTFGGGDRVVQVQGFEVPVVVDVPEASTWAALGFVSVVAGATALRRRSGNR